MTTCLLSKSVFDRELREVRARAAEVLAAIGPDKLRRVALFRARRWADSAVVGYEQDSHLADLAWMRAVEGLRIGLSLPLNDSEKQRLTKDNDCWD